MSLPHVLIVTHGSKGPDADPGEAGRLAGAVQSHVPGAEVLAATLAEDGALERALARLAGRPSLILPHFMSDGYFYARRVKPAVSDPGHTLLRPTALWPSFAPFLASTLTALAGPGVRDADLLLVAHGSGSDAASADAARAAGRGLNHALNRPADSPTRPSFLEEPPHAAETFRAQSRPFAAIGLFVGAGRHGRADFDAAVASAQIAPLASFIVADAPGLPEFLAAEVRRQLQRPPG